ncbi:MAG: trehalose-phosphatase [Chitinispirillaceae bacterium]
MSERKLSRIKAVLLDLDGVVTSTVELHTKAWKRMFDSYLEKYSQKQGTSFVPMDPVFDYKEYIDGRPRYEGVMMFLRSRNIKLPYGDESDEAGKETVCGLGNLKNQMYHTFLREEGVHVYDDAVEMVRRWRSMDLKTAVISASKNCREVLNVAGLTDLFDVIVDGNDAELNKLRGKPEPDTFVFASKLLGLDPSQSIVIEDAAAGVEAGRRGNFSLVVGVSRDGRSSELLMKNGADMVVAQLTEVLPVGPQQKRAFGEIPSALEHFADLGDKFDAHEIMVLLDYDGTLTPIVERPDLAVMSGEMRDAVDALSTVTRVAVVSGRDLRDVRNLVNLDNLYYSGSHGFETVAPDNTRMELDEARERILSIDGVEKDARSILSGIEGALVERKKFALAIHYRQVSGENVEKLKTAVQEIASGYPDLKLTCGKKVIEFRPDLPWDKGKAVDWIMSELYPQGNAVPLFIGDDITDEDAFREIKDWGIGILVGDHGESSFADYRLNSTDEVREFLLELKRSLQG